MTEEYNAVTKFNALSEEDKILKVYHHALVGLQTSLFNLMANDEDSPEMKQMKASTKEYQAYLKTVIDYLAPKIGHDPTYLYPH